MLQQVYFIDEEGYKIDTQVVDVDNPPDGAITTPLPNPGLYRPKWTGNEWVETMTEEEYIATLPKESLKPSMESESDILRDYVLELDYKMILIEVNM